MQQEEATLWWVSPVIKEEWSICSTDHTYAKSIELLQLRANLEPLGTAEFAHTPVMMMADSGLRLGLWINVRPDRQWRICRRSQMMRHFICIPDILAGSTLGFFFVVFFFFLKKCLHVLCRSRRIPSLKGILFTAAAWLCCLGEPLPAPAHKQRRRKDWRSDAASRVLLLFLHRSLSDWLCRLLFHGDMTWNSNAHSSVCHWTV